MFSLDFYKRLCEQASIGIIIIDLDFTIRMLNSTALQLFRVSEEDVLNQPIEFLVPENRKNVTRKLLGRAVQAGKSLEYRVKRIDYDARRTFSIMVDPVMNVDSSGSQTVEGVCLWVRDLTRRMELEQKLSESGKLASLGKLAGGVAHHFNNIFGGVVTAVDHALTSDDPYIWKRTLELITEGVNKAVDLSRKLLEFSSPELPEQDFVDLTEAVLNFVDQAEKYLDTFGHQIELDMKDIPILPVNPGKMKQILDVLLKNSVQSFTCPGGKIKITLDCINSHVRLLFLDNGPGIPSTILDRIFDPFFTTKGSLGGGAEGNLGLGLTIARRLAEDIGGSLDYIPLKDIQGTCFCLSFIQPQTPDE
jgi:PAS domain S-box-containing protein